MSVDDSPVALPDELEDSVDVLEGSVPVVLEVGEDGSPVVVEVAISVSPVAEGPVGVVSAVDGSIGVEVAPVEVAP